MQLDALGSWAGWLALVLFTLVIANAIALCLDAARARRVTTKVAHLSRTGGRQIPVTVVTGFLGAGKTVLLNRLLGGSALRICVIENEKGAVSIDHALLEKRSAAGVIVLKNGCLCCTADGAGESELERVLDRLAELTSSAGGDADVSAGFAAIEYIIIETSGLADPGPILQTFFRRDMQARFSLDGVIAVVDAKHVSHHLTRGGFLSRSSEAGRQVGFADIVLLNKVDIASSAELTTARAAIAAANPTALVVECVRCAVDPAMLLSRRYFDVSRTRGGPFVPARTEADASGDALAAPGHVHVEGVTAVTIETGDTSFDVRILQAWLQGFISEHWRQVYRVKGLLWVYSSSEAGTVEDGEAAGGSGEDEEESSPDAAGQGLSGHGRSGGSGDSSPPAPPPELRLFVVQGVHAEVHGVVLSASESRRVAERGEEDDSGAAFRGGPVTAASARRLRAGIVVIGARLNDAQVQASFAAACGPCGRLPPPPAALISTA